jgi:uncharacterized protein (UPF0335 family)
MTDDRNLWHDRCEAYKREVERTAQELTELRDAVRELFNWHDGQNWDARHPIEVLRKLRALVPEVKE